MWLKCKGENKRDIKAIQCTGYLPNRYSWTFNVVVFSHPGEFKRNLCWACALASPVTFLTGSNAFSSPEAALLLVSTKNRDLWPCPTTEVCDSRTSRHSAHALSQVWHIWLVLVSIYCVYKAIQNRNDVGPGQRSRFLVLTKGSADENGGNVVQIAFGQISPSASSTRDLGTRLVSKCQISKSPYVQYRVTRASFTRPRWSSQCVEFFCSDVSHRISLSVEVSM